MRRPFLLLMAFVGLHPACLYLSAQMAPGTFADATNPSGAPDPTKLESVWQVDPISGALSVTIPFTTTPIHGRGPQIPFKLIYNSASTITLQSSGATYSGGGTGHAIPIVKCADLTTNPDGCEMINGAANVGYSGGFVNIIDNYLWTSASLNSGVFSPSGPWTTTGPYIKTQQTTIGPQIYTVQEQTVNLGRGCGVAGPYLYTDETGQTHDLNLKLTYLDQLGGPLLSPTDGAVNICYGGAYQAPTGTTFDGSGMQTSVGNSNPIGNTVAGGASPYVIYPDGSQLNGLGLEDSNGNYAGLGQDSEGRAPFTTDFPIGHQGSLPLGTYSVATTRADGTSEPYSVTVGGQPFGSFTMPHPTSNEIISAGFCISLISCPTAWQVHQVNGDGPSSTSEVTSIGLPNGQAYAFTYDPTYGTISKIIFPTGGSVSFAWGILSDAGGYGVFAKHSALVVTDAYVSSGSGSPAHWAYTFYPYSTTAGLTSKIVAPDGTYSTYVGTQVITSNLQIFGSGSAPSWKVGDEVTYNSSGTIVRSISYGYDSGASGGLPVLVATTLYDGNTPLQKQIHFQHDQYANIVEQDESDFYPCTGIPCPVLITPPSGWLRKTLTSYQYQTLATWVTAHIVDRPSQVLVTDGSAHPYSLTQYGYDETAVTGPNGFMNHDDINYSASSTLPRGNLTSEKRCSVFSNTSTVTAANASAACSAWLTTKHTYDVTGKRLSTTDPKGYQTTYKYTDSYVSGSPAKPTNSYLTSVTFANGSQDFYSYYFATGQKASHTDWNNQITSLNFADPNKMNRITDIYGPPSAQNGGAKPHTQYSYVDGAAGSMTTVNPVGVTSVVYYDGLGRIKQSQLTTDPQGADCVDTTYDGVGQVASVSNPYRQTGGCTSPNNGITSYLYDPLGRKTFQCQPDNSSTPSITCIPGSSYLQWLYGGSIVSFTDESKNSWSRSSDGLGRLISISEPGALNTTYSYDALDNLSCVDQWSTGSAGKSCASGRARSFNYDALSRLLTATNPETGTVCYGIWFNGNCTNGYDANGNLQHKTDASGIVIDYTYDSLNRMLTKYSGFENATSYSMTYDRGPNGIGRLYEEENHVLGTNQFLAGTRFQYDSMGRVSSTIWGNYAQSQVQEGTQWQPGLQVQYDLAGNIVQLSYADGRVVSQTWDSAGHLSSSNAGPVGSSGVPYISAMQYTPSGTLQSATYGNGVSQTFTLNSRLQPCHQMASSSLFPTSSSGGNLMDRQEFYASPSETNCGNAQANNGNIRNVLEGVGSPFSQTFVYDGLNRLKQANSVNRPAAATYNQIYNYDAFGNMLLADQMHMSLNYGIDAATNRMTLNGDVNNGDLRYNANGTLAISPNVTGGYHNYMWTGEGNLRGIDGYGTGSYLYDSMGERTLAVRNNDSVDEYVYLNNQPMADLDVGTGRWQDFIYANGQKIATVDSMDAPIHISGDNCANCGGTSSSISLTSGTGHVIQSGDILSLTQYNVGNAVGGLILAFTDGSATSGLSAQDQYGQQINCDQMSGQFLYRHINLTPYAGKALAKTYVINDVCSPAGHFDQYFNDIAISSPDGTVTTIYSPSLGQAFSMTYSSLNGRGPVTNMRAVAEPNALAAAGSEVQKGTHYYLADQVGTTQMELSGGGWPVWQGYFTPFGQEIQNGGEQLVPGTVTADGTTNRYKFNGKERDTESGLDYFGARYYASTMGRFMSPDWAAKAEPVPYAKLDNPQSLNLYSYVYNNPLGKADADGHQPPLEGEVEPEEIEEGREENALTPIAPAPAMRQLTPMQGEVGKLLYDTPVMKAIEKNIGEPPQLAAGRAAHNNEEIRAGEKPEVPTPSRTGRMDRYNEDASHIREIKPDNPRAEKAGQKQLARYKHEMENATGRPHTTELTKYKTKPLPRDTPP